MEVFFGGLTSKEVSCSTLEVPSLEQISFFSCHFSHFFPYFCPWGYHRSMGQIHPFWMLFWRIFFAAVSAIAVFARPLAALGSRSEIVDSTSPLGDSRMTALSQSRTVDCTDPGDSRIFDMNSLFRLRRAISASFEA